MKEHSRSMVNLSTPCKNRLPLMLRAKDLFRTASTYGLALVISVICNGVEVSGETQSQLNYNRQQRVTPIVQSDNSGLLVTVHESPPVFERVGQAIDLVYVIKNTSGKNIRTDVYVADSDVQVICMPLKMQTLLPGATLQCSATAHIGQQHFLDGEMRHNFSAVSGGNVSNVQESVICRKGWKNECDTNTQIICDLHRKLKSTAVWPDICDAVISRSSTPVEKVSEEFKRVPKKSDNGPTNSVTTTNPNFALRRKRIVTVDLLPSAFAPYEETLLPMWKKKLGTVVQIISQEESLLKIILRSNEDPISLSKARISSVKSDLLSILSSSEYFLAPEIELRVIGRLTD